MRLCISCIQSRASVQKWESRTSVQIWESPGKIWAIFEYNTFELCCARTITSSTGKFGNCVFSHITARSLNIDVLSSVVFRKTAHRTAPINMNTPMQNSVDSQLLLEIVGCNGGETETGSCLTCPGLTSFGEDSVCKILAVTFSWFSVGMLLPSLALGSSLSSLIVRGGGVAARLERGR